MDEIRAADFVAQLLKLHPLEIWVALGTLQTMKQIAAGTHPVCKN
jgi:hypothetical protein